MNRRELLVLVGSVMAVARPLRAQQKAIPLIGWLHTLSAERHNQLAASHPRTLTIGSLSFALHVNYPRPRIDRRVQSGMTKTRPGPLTPDAHVGLKILKNQLSEYVLLAADGETVIITNRQNRAASPAAKRELS